jgi:hypothetical protein
MYRMYGVSREPWMAVAMCAGRQGGKLAAFHKQDTAPHLGVHGIKFQIR